MITDQIEFVKRSKGDFIFSILVPSWNNLSYLQLCINSINKNSSYQHQVIVHINEGSDGSLQWIQQQANIDYTYSKQNIGVCYALNACRTLVSTDYIVYINDDMYLCPGWDKVLLDEIHGLKSNMFFLSSTVIEPVASSDCVIEKNFGNSVETFNEESLLKQFASLNKSDWMGSTWPPNIVHKDVWDIVGGYSIEFSPGMYSDPDFSMKLWQAGVRYFKGVANSRAYHFGSKSTKRIKKNKGYYAFINKWHITSSTFVKLYLRRGKAFSGAATEPQMPLSYKLKNAYKRLQASFKK